MQHYKPVRNILPKYIRGVDFVTVLNPEIAPHLSHISPTIAYIVNL
ncbi:MAG: hypothetical protein VX800_04045 [Chloroflexota bacterium]|nr:hypothetical protein [Chloroflexota bacterium]